MKKETAAPMNPATGRDASQMKPTVRTIPVYATCRSTGRNWNIHPPAAATNALTNTPMANPPAMRRHRIAAAIQRFRFQKGR